MPDADISQFTSVFRSTQSHRVRRNRLTVSCTACQRRKSKCDRQQPCGACEKRGDTDTCLFTPKISKSTRLSGNGRSNQVQQKLNRLENMVKMMANPLEAHDTVDEGRNVDLYKPLKPNRNNKETRYQGATSWEAIAESIQDLQHFLHDDDDDESNPTEDDDKYEEPDLLLANVTPITMEDILSALPSRQDCDRLMSAYFNAKFQAVPFIHVHQFRRQYEAFLLDYSTGGFLWISMLFSILSAGAKIAAAVTSISHAVEDDPLFYTTISVRCLIAGQYLKNKSGSVEALVMHARSRYILRIDSDAVISALFGLAVRMAQRQGYHRDASKIASNLTPFEAEMRRRVWFLIQSSDLLYSFQSGVPTMVYDEVCDVGHPTNLTDEDFDEDTIEMPPPRTANDPTPILAYTIKSRLCSILRRIMRHALAVDLPPYSETMALNAALDNWYASLPACLQIRQIKDTAFTDANYTILHRLMLELMYRKSQCVLHRPYLSQFKDDATFDISRRICRTAADTMLKCHIDLNEAINLGGRMYSDRFMVSNLTINHFLVASTISCLDLVESSDITIEERQQRIKTLEKAQDIWDNRSTDNVDAKHVSNILRAVLSKVNTPVSVSVSVSASDASSLITTNSNHQYTENADFSLDQQIQIQTLDISNCAPNAELNEQPFDIDSLLYSAEALNWNSIDQYLRLGQSASTDWADMMMHGL